MDKLLKLMIQSGATLREAMQAIDQGACEIALVVDRHRKLLGTVTDGNIRRAILAGADLGQPVAPVMKRKFIAVAEGSSRSEALDLMRARVLRQIPILDRSGRLVGLHLMREMIGADPKENWAVVMAGGRGERLRPITDHTPKPMIRVAGRPILERIVLHLVGHGVRTIYLAVNYKSQMIEKHFGDGREFGCSIAYLRETEPLGTGGALSLLPRRVVLPLLVLNGDLVTQVNISDLLHQHRRQGNRITVGVHEHFYTVPFGVVKERRGRITEVLEKPTASWLVNAGIYVLEPALIHRIPKGHEFPLPALLEDALDRRERVGTFGIKEEWMDIGLPMELKKARGED